jgi:hypothetical protein
MLVFASLPNMTIQLMASYINDLQICHRVLEVFGTIMTVINFVL